MEQKGNASDMNPEVNRQIRAIGDEAREALTSKHQAREQGLRLSRDIIRYSANAIRAIHRGEFQEADRLLSEVSGFLEKAAHALEGHPDIYYAGFLEDAQKEYAEAWATLAFTKGSPLPGPKELGIGYAPYLNGLGEAIGELRRYILDSLRRDDTSRCEELLDVMDEVYTLLVTMDFPEAVTRGMRRTADMMRGVLERTRGDLTIAVRQRRLEEQLRKAQDRPSE